MKLIDLEPEWLSPHMFVFKSPVGQKDYVTCKNKPMDFMEQYNLIYDNPKYKGKPVVMSDNKYAWKFNGDNFETISVYPSIDNGASGNWHGYICNGELIGGLD